MKKTYENAMKILESRRRTARPKGLPSGALSTREMPNVHGAPTFSGTPSLVGMRQWLQRIGHSDNDVNNLHIIHIAGTKGKGSTCAFVRSFLLAHGLRTGFPKKIGLYTSPDLRCIRERIQINHQPIIEAVFAKYFFEVWDRLSVQDARLAAGESQRLPRYLQLIALVAFHTFIREDIEAAIYETHHGGEYDATNVIEKPIVTGITPIGMDHVEQLGPSIENVAWHKAGIFKEGAAAYSAQQERGPSEVMQARAAEKGVSLKFVHVDESLPADARALKVKVQRENCSLALALASAFLERKAPLSSRELTLDDIALGIETFSWPGRFETIMEGTSQWFLDGAHNELSVKQAAEWFAKILSETKNVPSSCPRILIFSHYSEERDGEALLDCLGKSLLGSGIRPQHVIFTTYNERLDGTTRIDKTFKIPETPYPDFLAIYPKLWKKMDPEAIVSSESTIEGALNLARRIGQEKGGMQTLVTGSLFLVGGALSLLRPL